MFEVIGFDNLPIDTFDTYEDAVQFMRLHSSCKKILSTSIVKLPKRD